ncbi:MAG: alpha/beta hydrolase [Acetobacteraceae bacterium]|nr:alpha/beta hydrolase [Acetobacteraceae bacterium]
MTVAWSDAMHEIAGMKMHLARAGSGRPLLVLHHDIGTPERLPFYDALAQSYDVLVPHHPGWGRSERPQWLRSVRDIAAMHAALLAELQLQDVSLVGLGFGGWIAAEMATLAPTTYHRLVLVGPMGIKPPEGEIMDQAIVSYIDYPRAGFHDQAAFARVYGDVTTDQLEQWDICREMVFRTAWKPYMYSQTLPHLISGIRTPVLLVWGDDDKHVPQSAAQPWLKGLRNTKLERVAACGHYVEMEKPEELAKLIQSFVNAN